MCVAWHLFGPSTDDERGHFLDALEDFEGHDEHDPGHYLPDQTIYKIPRSRAFIYHQEEGEDAFPTYPAPPDHGRSDSTAITCAH